MYAFMYARIGSRDTYDDDDNDGGESISHSTVGSHDSFDSDFDNDVNRGPMLNQFDMLGETLEEEYKDSGMDMPESLRNIIGTFDGAPVVVQTGSGIKIVAEIPKVSIDVNMSDLIRFVHVFLSSPELRSYLGARNEKESEELDELLAFIKVCLHNILCGVELYNSCII